MAYRRARSIRELFEQRVMGRSRPGPYQRMPCAVNRRPPINWAEDDFDLEADRGYHGERAPYGGGKRGGPPYRRENPYFHYRGSAGEPLAARQSDLRNNRMSSHPRGQRLPPPRPLLTVPRRGDDSVMSDPVNPDQGNECESLEQKASSPPSREQSPPKREVSPGSHSQSSLSSSPECSKTGLSQPLLPEKTVFQQEKEEPPSDHSEEPCDGSPHSSVLATKLEDKPVVPVEQSEETNIEEDAQLTPEACRTYAIANKVLEIEKLYRQDCETFCLVVKMLVAKQPALEKQLETALQENLTEIKERCMEDLRNFISEVNEEVKDDQF